MADNTESEQLEKRVETPEPDPITESSMSGLLLIFSLLMVISLIWSLYDELLGQRPWKGYQKDFVAAYTDYLDTIAPRAEKTEKELKESDEYKSLEQEAADAHAESADRVKEIDSDINFTGVQLNDVTPPFQDKRAQIGAITYQLEISDSESAKRSLREKIEDVKAEPKKFDLHTVKGSDATETKSYNFGQLEDLYNNLREQKAKLSAERVEATKKETDIRKKLESYVQENMVGLSLQQINGLKKKYTDDFKFDIKQINLAEANVVDRCESCHLGIREPLVLTKRAMGGEAAFVSHPDKDLLKTHDPERFGCSTCHGGNGRATTSVERGHGRYEHWLWPMYYKENVQAGCNQCHDRDRVVPGADVLNAGKDLFANRGCMGCHRYEGFDRETDALASARQNIKQLEMEADARRREIKLVTKGAEDASDDEQAKSLLHKADSLRQTISQVEAKIDQLDIQSKYLMQDQKKVGPNLKEIKLKLKRDWVPMWLRDPQAFRPGTKMPAFRLDDDEIQAISAFLWQSAIDGPALPKQALGDANHGRELFKSLGCLACHSIDGKLIGEADGRVGGTFAADLSRVGEKANYDYIVRWIHNPRQRTAPYSPSLKRDLTPDDYKKKNLPFVFDADHSRSPIDGRELQIQNMTVMPNFRLSEADARDIATFLMTQKGRDYQLAPAPYMEDVSLKARGEKLVRTYGCAGCHEIRGLEEEQRIGTELTKEGSKPIERLDFAALTHDAKASHDPLSQTETPEPWYNHKGFFERKLASPSIYDLGKEKTHEDRLKMPNIFLEKKDITALTTFLLGSVESTLPTSIRYEPEGGQKDVQNGWWVVKKYNCMGCHNVLIGQDSILMGLSMYAGDAKEQLPPRITSEGARVNPEWLLRFLKDPSLSGGETGGGAAAAKSTAAKGAGAAGGEASEALPGQPGANRNGVRQYLRVRMPTFNFSPNELQALVNFFMGASSQTQPYIPEKLDPLTTEEQTLGRALFTSPAAPCLKCHMTGDAAHDARATAPNFLLARERLKPEWTRRWLLDPALISPGTSMPSGLFKHDAQTDRWVLNGALPPDFQAYDKDHPRLLVRYMFQITPDEQRRLSSSASAATSGTPTPAPKATAWIRRPAADHAMTKAGG